MFDRLASLDIFRTSWRIEVRVKRMWPSLSSGSNGSDGFKGYNLILLDDDYRHENADAPTFAIDMIGVLKDF
ncbi:hypothetical protein ACET3Z_018174 [Daucus carota]